MESHKQVRLFVEPEVRNILEKRRISDKEIQKTLFAAEHTSQKFVHSKNGHFLAGVRQKNVSIWVEYSPIDNGYEIFNAYQYRAKILAWDFKSGHTR